jgi:D-alanyl-D-alanine carboxypeptidase
MRLPVFRSVVAKRSYRLAAGSGHHAYRWKNLNPLLGRYPGAIGIKPGYTGAAGQCLLFEATRHGHTVIGVTLHSPGSISSVNPADATRILNWAFSRPELTATRGRKVWVFVIAAITGHGQTGTHAHGPDGPVRPGAEPGRDRPARGVHRG